MTQVQWSRYRFDSLGEDHWRRRVAKNEQQDGNSVRTNKPTNLLKKKTFYKSDCMRKSLEKVIGMPGIN